MKSFEKEKEITKSTLLKLSSIPLVGITGFIIKGIIWRIFRTISEL